MDKTMIVKLYVEQWVHDIVVFINQTMIDTEAKYLTWLKVVNIIDREDYLKKIKEETGRLTYLDIQYSDLFYLETLDKVIEEIDIKDFENEDSFVIKNELHYQ